MGWVGWVGGVAVGLAAGVAGRLAGGVAGVAGSGAAGRDAGHPARGGREGAEGRRLLLGAAMRFQLRVGGAQTGKCPSRSASWAGSPTGGTSPRAADHGKTGHVTGKNATVVQSVTAALASVCASRRKPRWAATRTAPGLRPTIRATASRTRRRSHRRILAHARANRSGIGRFRTRLSRCDRLSRTGRPAGSPTRTPRIRSDGPRAIGT